MQGSDVQTRTEPPKSKQQFHVKKKKGQSAKAAFWRQ